MTFEEDKYSVKDEEEAQTLFDFAFWLLQRGLLDEGHNLKELVKEFQDEVEVDDKH